MKTSWEKIYDTPASIQATLGTQQAFNNPLLLS